MSFRISHPQLARRSPGAAMTGKNRIMIYGPKDDGTYAVEFRTAEGDVLSISILGDSSCRVSQARVEKPGSSTPAWAVARAIWHPREKSPAPLRPGQSTFGGLRSREH